MPKKFSSDEERKQYYATLSRNRYQTDPDFRQRKIEAVLRNHAKKQEQKKALLESGEVVPKRRGRPPKYSYPQNPQNPEEKIDADSD